VSSKISNKPIGKAERDLLALGIAVAAIILFIGTGGSVLPDVIDSLFHNGQGADNSLVSALLLNIALIIFGWRRYTELRREITERREAEARAKTLAAIDPLTGCLNRRSDGISAPRCHGERASRCLLHD